MGHPAVDAAAMRATGPFFADLMPSCRYKAVRRAGGAATFSN
jgi:hypothetical protein